MILGFADYQQQGEALAKALACPFALIEIHRFPDGESKLTVPQALPEQVILCRSLNQPNDKLIELLLATQTLRAQGVRHLTLVAPYLCYMRQDIAFHPGEAVSQRIIGQFLAEQFDKVVTVDPHLHRIERLDQAIIGREAIALASAALMGQFLRQHTQQPLLLGPDEESAQWVRAIAEPAGLDWAVASKHRLGDREVEILLPERDYAAQAVVLVDDMISTGHTLINVARQLRAHGAKQIDTLVTHALCDESTLQALQQAGITHVWSSDSIPHPTNAVPLAALLASAC